MSSQTRTDAYMTIRNPERHHIFQLYNVAVDAAMELMKASQERGDDSAAYRAYERALGELARIRDAAVASLGK